VTEVGVVDTRYGVSQPMLPAAGLMQAGLAAATDDDGQRDSDLGARSAISPQTGLGGKPLVMVALCNRADHYIFILFLLLSFFFFLLFFLA